MHQHPSTESPMAYGFAPQSERPSTYRRHDRSKEALAPQIRELKSSFLAQFASLEDPRVERSQLHHFIDIILRRDSLCYCRRQRLGRYGELWNQ